MAVSRATFIKLSNTYYLCPVTEIVTPPLDGIILPGVTRDSVLALARGHASGESPIEGMPEGKLVVSERPVTMKEVVRAAESGNLLGASQRAGSTGQFAEEQRHAQHHRKTGWQWDMSSRQTSQGL